VAGDGPMRDALSRQAARQLPSRFTLLSLPPAQMPELYRSADVFLHMSLEEAFGNVFIEALACGLPVVGHDTDRLRWIVADEGCLVDTTSSDDVARTIDEAARGGALRRDLRIRRAADFSWDRIGAMYLDFLNQIVAESQVPKLRGSRIA
jgi:glycosyltransferase involved in cell wall biosynthesis